MEGKRKAEFMAVAVQPKKPRSEVVGHAGEKVVVQSVRIFLAFILFSCVSWPQYILQGSLALGVSTVVLVNH